MRSDRGFLLSSSWVYAKRSDNTFASPIYSVVMRNATSSRYAPLFHNAQNCTNNDKWVPENAIHYGLSIDGPMPPGLTPLSDYNPQGLNQPDKGHPFADQPDLYFQIKYKAEWIENEDNLWSDEPSKKNPERCLHKGGASLFFYPELNTDLWIPAEVSAMLDTIM